MRFNLREFGGTFVGEDRPSLSTSTGRTKKSRKPVPVGNRTSASIGSYAFIPEVLEEDRRVNTAGQFRLPERWFVPRPTEKVSLWVGRGKKARFVTKTRFLRRNESFSMPGGRTPLTELSSWDTETEPVFVPCTDRARAIAQLLILNPYMVRTVYEKAMEPLTADDLTFDDRLDDKLVPHQAILASLIEAMHLIPDQFRDKVKQEVSNMKDNGRVLKHMKAALGLKAA